MQLKYEFEKMVLDDQIIAIPVNAKTKEFSGVVKLNETAGFIFDQLSSEITKEEIIGAMQKEYDASREELISGVEKCIEMFQKEGLLAE